MKKLALFAVPLFAAQAEQADTKDPFAALKYRLVGPYAGGRVSRVAGMPGVPSTHYAATVNGGVWKSTNGGFAWQPISSIGSLAVAAGNDIYKSVDAGKTWTHARRRRHVEMSDTIGRVLELA